ncbi:MAG: hypothetical protein RR840_04990 [Clostridium sp.]
MHNVEKILSYIKDNRVNEAQKMLIEDFKDRPGSFYYYLGLINLKKEDYKSAIVCFKSARDNGVESHLLSYNLSVCYVNLDQNEWACNELINTLQLEPEFFKAYTNLCNVYLRLKKPREAYRTVKYGQAIFSEDEDNLETLTKIEKNLYRNKYIG